MWKFKRQAVSRSFISASLSSVIFVSGCGQQETNSQAKANISETTEQRIERNLTATNGTPASFAVCPSSVYDTIAPIKDLNPPAKAGEPEMTVEGVQAYMDTNNITTIEQLLNALPDRYRNNFSLVEVTRATGESNVKFPRIVLFGSDGRFMMNVGTKADDPKYNLLDVAELHEDTGKWEFSVFNFEGETPTLTRNDPSCIECHGDANSRPVWGTNLLWPGVFGDNIAKGPQGEALDTKHAERMNEIIDGQGGSPRFDFLHWGPERPRRGGKRKIANHILGVDLFLSNMAMGSATSRGTFVRLSQNFPEKYKALREELLFAYYLKKGNAYITDKEEAVITSLNKKLDISSYDLDTLLATLGLDTSEAFSVSTLAHKEEPIIKWSMGRGDLHDMLMLQILDDWRQDNPEIDKMLKERVIENAIFGCPDTANSIADVIDYKMLHLFYLKGDAKYEVHKRFYPLDLEDIYGRVFIPISHKMIAYLRDNISEEI